MNYILDTQLTIYLFFPLPHFLSLFIPQVNESQRHPNVAQEMNPLDKITKRILASIHDIEMNREADID